MRFLLFVSASLVLAQPPEEHWFVARDAPATVSKQTSAAMRKAACEGGTCVDCPGAWSIFAIGHFSSPTSEEAIVDSGCQAGMDVHYGEPIGMLVGKRNGKWIFLSEILATKFAPCTRRRLRSGREFLICEDWDQHSYGHQPQNTYSLYTVTVENNDFKVHPLFAATNNSKACVSEGTAVKAQVQSVKFRDLNGDGLQDISITATYGSFKWTKALRDQCDAAQERSKKYPQPSAVKTYKIDLLFDGNSYKPTPESRAGAALFTQAR